MRTKITLACSECKQRNYNTFKNKKNDPDRLEMNKSLPFLQEAYCSQRIQIRELRLCLKENRTGYRTGSRSAS